MRRWEEWFPAAPLGTTARCRLLTRSRLPSEGLETMLATFSIFLSSRLIQSQLAPKNLAFSKLGKTLGPKLGPSVKQVWNHR